MLKEAALLKFRENDYFEISSYKVLLPNVL